MCAGSLDTFQIFVWSVKTGRLLDILAAHEGPVVALAFSPTQALLASVSWDRTLRTWDVFSGKGTYPAVATCSPADPAPECACSCACVKKIDKLLSAQVALRSYSIPMMC